jgi:hypothetical protein
MNQNSSLLAFIILPSMILPSEIGEDGDDDDYE